MNKELFLGPDHAPSIPIELLVIIIALIIVAFFIMAIIFSIIDGIAASKEKKKEKMKILELENELKTVKEKLDSLAESNIKKNSFKLMPPANPYCLSMVNCSRVNFIEIKPTEKNGQMFYALALVYNPYYPPLWQKDTYRSVDEAFDEAKEIFGDLLSDDIQKKLATPFELWMSQTKRDNEKHKIVDDFLELFSEDKQTNRKRRKANIHSFTAGLKGDESC